jgi:hypothetical protein
LWILRIVGNSKKWILHGAKTIGMWILQVLKKVLWGDSYVSPHMTAAMGPMPRALVYDRRDTSALHPSPVVSKYYHRLSGAQSRLVEAYHRMLRQNGTRLYNTLISLCFAMFLLTDL